MNSLEGEGERFFMLEQVYIWSQEEGPHSFKEIINFLDFKRVSGEKVPFITLDVSTPVANLSTGYNKRGLKLQWMLEDTFLKVWGLGNNVSAWDEDVIEVICTWSNT